VAGGRREERGRTSEEHVDEQTLSDLHALHLNRPGWSHTAHRSVVGEFEVLMVE